MSHRSENWSCGRSTSLPAQHSAYKSTLFHFTTSLILAYESSLSHLATSQTLAYRFGLYTYSIYGPFVLEASWTNDPQDKKTNAGLSNC